MYVSGSVHKWDCVCLCAGVRLRALAAACVSLRVCYLYRESPLSLSLSLPVRLGLSPSSAELGWALKPDGRLRCKKKLKKNQLKFSPVDTFIKRKLILFNL